MGEKKIINLGEETMKQLICQAPFQFVYKQAEKPTLHEGEALIRILRIGICGTDFHAYSGNQPYFTYPRILGHELSGEIVALNDHQSTFNVGDQVAINPYQECGHCQACQVGKTNCCERLEVRGVHRDGGMQEYVAIPTSHLILTNDIDLDAATIVECLSIGAHAVRRADLHKDDLVLVTGAGPIGLGVMKLAKLAGARVLAMDMNTDRLEFSKQWAAVDATIHVTENPLEKLTALTNGELPVVVFDATGNKKSMKATLNYVAFGGKIVFVGLTRDNLSFYHPDFHQKEMTILSSRNATQIDFEHVLQAMHNGVIDTDSFITHKISFQDAAHQFETLMEAQSDVIKAIIEL